jgi:diguanylate cyclase (GGDEF)-like protein
VEGPAGLRGPAGRTSALAALLLCSPLLLLVTPISTSFSLRSSAAGFVGLTALFALGGVVVFHLEFRDEAHTFTLSELPLVLALFTVSPFVLIAARLLGEGLSLVFDRAQTARKALFNAGVVTSECVAALLVFHSVFGAPTLVSPQGWIAALVAVSAAELVTHAAVATVIRWHGGHHSYASLGFAASASILANGSLGITAALLFTVHPAALLLIAVIAAIFHLLYAGYARVQARYASLQVLYDFTEILNGSSGADEVVAAMLQYARRSLRADFAELLLFPAHGGILRHRLQGDRPLQHAPVGEDEALVRALEAWETTLLQPRGVRTVASPYLDTLGVEDGVIVRLPLDDAVGVLTVGGRLTDVSTFDGDDARLFETLASHAGMALEKGQLIEKLQTEADRRMHQALHDELTGLPNRSQFRERAGALLRGRRSSDSKVAVLLMDLDNFKEVNDTLGHQTGDELLQEVARRLRELTRADDIAARLGGDEFALLLTEVDGQEQALAAAHRLIEGLRAPVQLRGIDLEITCSVGVAVSPDHGTDVTQLLQRADVAMYDAKSSLAGARCYDQDVDQYSPRRLQLVADLRKAIDNQELDVHYQPKACLRTRRILGVEALVRWQHAEHGAVYPDEFIPVAEHTGLITSLTWVVLSKTLAQWRVWHEMGIELDVSVNVAARSLLESSFAAQVGELLEQHDVPARRLMLEITESSIMSDTARAADSLQELSALGVQLSVDDFGTGYSSLAYLQRLPVQELKVDRSFVFNVDTDSNDQAIVRSVVELGHSLGLSVVAEGVENQLAWNRLVSLGCDVAQGYFLSRPIPGEDMTRWLQVTAGMAAIAPLEAAAR